MFLVHCENGTLLIDEFENGLHWSVQAELWKLICRLSEKLNIQIFVATHSRDIIWTLQQAVLAVGHEEETSVIKLKELHRKQMFKAVTLEIEDVKLVLEQNFEIR